MVRIIEQLSGLFTKSYAQLYEKIIIIMLTVDFAIYKIGIALE